jgi:hypothetical protein
LALRQGSLAVQAAIKREQLVKAVTEAKYDVDLPEQKVSCTLAQKKEVRR